MFHKFIVTHEAAGAKFCNAFIVSTVYSHSFENFTTILNEARKDFTVKDSAVECLSVRESRWVKGCPLIRFSLPVGAEAEGWTQCEGKLPDVSW